jgi:hypothetical protein
MASPYINVAAMADRLQQSRLSGTVFTNKECHRTVHVNGQGAAKNIQIKRIVVLGWKFLRQNTYLFKMHSCSPVSFRSNTFRLVEIEPITISSLKIKIKGFEIAGISV